MVWQGRADDRSPYADYCVKPDFAVARKKMLQIVKKLLDIQAE